MGYEHLLIKDYEKWGLYIHKEQYPYLGRCVAWAKRPDAERIIDMDPVERDELFGLIIPAWDSAIKRLYNHDWPNVACLGNTVRHLHWHLIPRYHSVRNFHGIDFIDPRPDANYAPYEKKDLGHDIIIGIKDEIKKMIG
ncbi:hypothetical protein COV93_06790 [Candidatus Woesearchaeota archaeon CG11_big_fil_rev_8_21_14_0_20_43_8]|nr:MAG: hypothetical protein COV93_06790 [Candidatus Woesearchaeota archaeon CG11_big_fil_rev_8_21_14_0_20_43_8]PIO05094.1 MAG: hypothetical protein COT47_06300 [Candidatus Woesearchaeota archaeon CG08_land_8_20_14_0_20_43_7]